MTSCLLRGVAALTEHAQNHMRREIQTSVASSLSHWMRRGAESIEPFLSRIRDNSRKQSYGILSVMTRGLRHRYLSVGKSKARALILKCWEK